ncbi:hypothetical protein [Microbacterium sp. LWH12-1.2]|uniref:hypothetical protein n=1 Tax=Microbacterium sp. LWH12-1.2 TaxID=3135259 RepID=UPI00343FFE2B
MMELVDGEVELTDDAEIYWRQCAPCDYDEDNKRPTDRVFRATDADKGKMSGARSRKASAEAAYLHRTTVVKKPSKGTWGVSVGVVKAAGSRVVDDSVLQPAPPPNPPPGHSYVDVRHLDDLNKRERQRFRSTLLIAAFLAHSEP